MLFAERGGASLAFACSHPWLESSCGFVGVNDGWTDLKANRKITMSYPSAREGNIALTGQIDLNPMHSGCVLALAFGRNTIEAGEVARASLLDSFQDLAQEYEAGWENYQKLCLSLGTSPKGTTNFYRVSTAVLKTHQSKHFVGGMIASLSIPWGFNAGDNDLGGYHLVWPRDLAESAGALLACGDRAGALDALRYLLSTQEADGHWPQNMWLDGRSYWKGIQLDETAFPILLADSLFRQAALHGVDPWPEVRLAAAFIATNGPVTLQDRWEEDGGFSPFTLGVVIAAWDPLHGGGARQKCSAPRFFAFARKTSAKCGTTMGSPRAGRCLMRSSNPTTARPRTYTTSMGCAVRIPRSRSLASRIPTPRSRTSRGSSG